MIEPMIERGVHVTGTDRSHLNRVVGFTRMRPAHDPRYVTAV